jgi:hypothetical protein
VEVFSWFTTICTHHNNTQHEKQNIGILVALFCQLHAYKRLQLTLSAGDFNICLGRVFLVALEPAKLSTPSWTDS